jgi:hypothetical protein
LVRFRHYLGSIRSASSNVLKLIVVCLLSLFWHCNRPATRQSAAHQEVEHSSAKPQLQTSQPALPDCDLSPMQLEASKIAGHHRVVLTWNPSISSSGPNDQSVGYCLYRSRKDDITAKDLKDCKNCERLNRRPVIGTGCVDTHVKDGATYHYVAGAIRVGAKVDRLSNKATAAVPTDPRSKGSDTQYPLCISDDSPQIPELGKPNR